MATAQTLIDRALRLLGQIEAGADPTSDESADALEAMNAMAESWRNDELMCYALQEEALTLANADPSYTIGPSGDLNTTRPVAIEAAWIVDGNTSYPVRIMFDEEYAAIPDKTTTSDWPDRLLYRPTMATGTIIVYPVPNATRTLKLLTRVPFTGFAAVGTTVTLPPGWEEALATNLALALAPEYETEASPRVVKMADKALRGIRRTNSKPVMAYTDLAGLVGGGGRGNILSDT